MKANLTKGMLTLLLMGSLILSSCGPLGAAPTSQPTLLSTATPTMGPTSTAASTATPAPSPTIAPSPSPRPTSTPLPPTVQPSATPPGGSLVMEIVGESTQHTFIKSGETAVLPYWHEYVVLVHYPYLLGSTEGGGFQPYPIKVDVSSPDWQAEVGNFPNGQTLNLHLLGTAPGRFTVTVGAGSKVQPVWFTLEVQPPASTATPVASQPRSVTLADDGQTITLHVGDRFLLDLGEGFDWQVNVADPTIVSRVVNVLVIRGAQGIDEAKQPGTTTLTATGDPPCRKAQPPCGAPSRLFRIRVTVL